MTFSKTVANPTPSPCLPAHPRLISNLAPISEPGIDNAHGDMFFPLRLAAQSTFLYQRTP